MNTHRLSVGILVDSMQVSAWAYYMVQQIVEGDYAKISLVINAAMEASFGSESQASINFKVSESICRGINWLDRWLNPVSPDAFAQKNLQELLTEVPSIHVKMIRHGEYDFFVKCNFKCNTHKKPTTF